MANTSMETAEEPVLLSWETPAPRRKLLVTVFRLCGVMLGLGGVAVVLDLALYIGRGAPLHEPTWTSISPPIMLFFWLNYYIFSMPLSAGAARVECRNSGLTIDMLVGRQRRVRWDEILRLSRSMAHFTVLQYGERGKQYVYLHIGADIRNQLIAILRETSNARIVGFGTEES